MEMETPRKYRISQIIDTDSNTQYPHQASNSRRTLGDGADADESSPVRHHYPFTVRGYRADSHSSDAISKSAAKDYQYSGGRRPSLPSQVVTPDSEQPVSPVVSDIDDRNDMIEPHREEPRQNRTERIPTRTSSKQRPSSNTRRPPPPVHRPSGSTSTRNNMSGPPSPGGATERGFGPGDRSSAESIMSQETAATSVHTLPALQTKGPDNSDAQELEPLIEDDPRSWDLVEPWDESTPKGMYALEQRSEQMFSSEHLRTIFNDPKLLLKFTGFLNSNRPKSIAILIYYLDALKAIRAIEYANAIAEALDPIRGHEFTHQVAQPTKNTELQEKADAAFDILAREDLPAFISHTWVQVVSISIQRRITGTLAPHLREASEGLAEVFCLTDPGRTDNPIVFASEEFVRMTQYGMNYVIGRNCRFLQGPKTNPHSVRRLAMSVQNQREHTEVFVNYRRDGSPFMNLLMSAPLMDSRGNVRYYIGAQVDVSGLVKECSSLEGLTRMIEREQDPEGAAEEDEANKKDEFQELSEMFNGAELDTVRKHGGRMHKEYVDDSDRESISQGKRRVLLQDTTQEVFEKHSGVRHGNIAPAVKERINGKLEGVYQNYLLIRPAPSLRILFTSPSLRVPGILQSPFLNRIGGSSRVRDDLRAALGEGRGVTAKIRWLTKADEDGDGEGRPRWIHCTPLFGHSGAVGVWMIVLVDEEGGPQSRRFRTAPPVSSSIGGKEWDSKASRQTSQDRNTSRDRKALNSYDADADRKPGMHSGASRRNSHSVNYSRDTSQQGRPVSSIGSAARPAATTVNSGDVSEFSFQLK